jgi:hypothetical protein
MKIKKNTFASLALELLFPYIAKCRKLKIQKIQKSTSPNVETNFPDQSMWMTEFSVTYMFWTCVTLGFSNSEAVPLK